MAKEQYVSKKYIKEDIDTRTVGFGKKPKNSILSEFFPLYSSIEAAIADGTISIPGAIGDNLGDHTATELLDMATFQIDNLGSPTTAYDQALGGRDILPEIDASGAAGDNLAQVVAWSATQGIDGAQLKNAIAYRGAGATGIDDAEYLYLFNGEGNATLIKSPASTYHFWQHHAAATVTTFNLWSTDAVAVDVTNTAPGEYTVTVGAGAALGSFSAIFVAADFLYTEVVDSINDGLKVIVDNSVNSPVTVPTLTCTGAYRIPTYPGVVGPANPAAYDGVIVGAQRIHDWAAGISSLVWDDMVTKIGVFQGVIMNFNVG